jgi:prepilin-type N-terminal cleavage/methylation domain-containing protein
MRRPSRGFTLWEMAIVLAVMSVAAVLVAPAITRLGESPPPKTADSLLALLRDSRKAAIEHNAIVTLLFDPVSGHFRADSVGAGGAGLVAEGTLALGATETMETALPRLRYVFRPTGAAYADSVLVRGFGETVLVTVDPWSGVARTDAR